MKSLLLVAGVGLSLYGVYLLSKNGGCGCDKKKAATTDPGSGSGATIVKLSIDGKQDKNPLYPDKALTQFDASFDAIFPSSRKAIGSTVLSSDEVDQRTIHSQF